MPLQNKEIKRNCREPRPNFNRSCYWSFCG